MNAQSAGIVDLQERARLGAIHFMGIGGAGMSPLAALLLHGGATITGCDVRPEAAAALGAAGAVVYPGHDASHLEGVSALVITAAVPSDHPEVVAARTRGIPVLKRAQALGALVNNARLVGVSGTHGKTSTTAMVVEVLTAAGLDPTGLVGGRVQAWGGNLRRGGQALYVVEADEYDRSFLTLEPDVAVVTTLEADHLDTYGDLSGVIDAFTKFVHRVPDSGRVFVCADDSGASRLLPALGRRGYSYGTRAGSQLRATDLSFSPAGSRFRVVEDGHPRAILTLSVPGAHNVRNALAAAAVARHLGASWEEVQTGLAAYRGVARRFERLGEVGGVTVIDDYAHHPTEIVATLKAARRAFHGRRLVAVFQPHLFSRTRDFSADFGAALSRADLVWVTDVYPARESPIPGVTGELVADATRAAGAADVHYMPDLAALPGAVIQTLEPGDVCVVMGAGNVDTVAPAILRGLGAVHV